METSQASSGREEESGGTGKLENQATGSKRANKGNDFTVSVHSDTF